MTTKLIMPGKPGEKIAYTLALHAQAGVAGELKLVTATSTESFPEWLFFFLRDHGAYIETSDPKAIRAALNLPENETGVVKAAA